MSVSPFTTLPSGEVNFSIDFVNVVFGIIPAVFCLTVVLIIVISRWPSRAVRCGRSANELAETALLLSLLILHLSSLVISCRLPKQSTLGADSFNICTYALRLVASLMVFFGRLMWNTNTLLVTNIYFLITCIADGVRVYTVWRLAKLDTSTDFALPALQIAIIIMTTVAFLFSEFCLGAKPRGACKGSRVHISEPRSGATGMLFFGWLWPLLKYGIKNKFVADDFRGATLRSTATYTPPGTEIHLMDAGFWGSVAVHGLAAVLVRLLGAAATLAQPFIINGIVSFLQSDKDHSIGVWLVVAMLFDQLANSLLQAHGEQLFVQLATRVRSFIIHNVAFRSFGRTPPENADWEAAGGKVMVRLSQDSASVAGAIIMSGVIIPNIVVVGAGSYFLFRYINLAFLGPLLAAIVCFLAPMLLGRPLSRSQRRFLEAAESRIQIVKSLISEIRNIRFGNMQDTVAQHATQSRQREIDAAITFRRVLAFVVVISAFTMSLANLAAFGGFALLPRLEFDYTILFTSLSMIQIMIMPLLSIIQMLPEFFNAIVSWKRIRDYVAEGKNKEEIAAQERESKGDTDDSLLYLNNAAAEWAPDSTIFKNVYLSVSSGEVLVVSGVPGCGKSSLLKALLGETRIIGTVRLSAKRVMYCEQVPWFVPEMTVKESILFGRAFNSDLYAEVLTACCLDHDLSTLPNGEATKLASNGSPLSGGQRKRVSLARALYDEDGDLVLLDDIFSGLDAKTRTQLAINVFGPNGFLQKRRVAAILCCTEAPPILSGATNARFFHLDSGDLAVVEKIPVSSAADDKITCKAGSSGALSESSITVTPEYTKSTEQAPGCIQATGEAEEATGQAKETTSKGHRLYLKSLGSLTSLVTTALLLLAWIAVDKGSSFWLSHWAGKYARSDGRASTGYHIGIYAAFAGAGLMLSFVLISMVFLKLIPASSISLHEDMLSVVVRTPACTTEMQQSETVNRFMNDIEAVDQDLPQALENLTTALGSSLGSLVVIAIGSPYAIISLIVLIPFLWLLQKVYLSTSFQLRTLQIAARAPMLEVSSATVQGRLTVRALRGEAFMSRVISDRIHHALLMGYIFTSVQNWAILVLNLLNGCLATAVAGLLVGLGGSQSAGWGGLALVNTITLGQDAMLLLMWWTRFESSMASMERIFDYTQHTPQEKAVSPVAVVPDTWPETGEIELESLSLNYTAHAFVSDISVRIDSGSKVAILGRTGSGKTSLLQAFFGLIRYSGGTLHVDGAELSHVNSNTLRRCLVGHPQKFIANSSGSVRSNLDPFDNLTDARIEEVLSQVMTVEMSAEVMSKLNAQWSECSFSEGWQQHIGICRTLLRTSMVYVLDEPTSGMSEARHTAVMEALFSATAGKTVVTTTHTLIALEKFDQVIVIQDGRLVEQGSPSELINNVGSRLSELIRADL